MLTGGGVDLKNNLQMFCRMYPNDISLRLVENSPFKRCFIYNVTDKPPTSKMFRSVRTHRNDIA